MVDEIKKYVVRQTLRRKTHTQVLSFYEAVWGGKVIMLLWNPVAMTLLDVYGVNVSLEADELQFLQGILCEHSTYLAA